MTVPELPSNSKLKKPSTIKARKVERPKPLLARVLGDDPGSIVEYVFWDVIVPTTKSLVSDVITNALEMLLYGGDKPQQKRSRDRFHRDGGSTYVSYSSMYKEREKKRMPDRRRSTGIDTNDIVVNSREDGEDVITSMLAIIDEYEAASVADFYQLCGFESEWTHQQYGWTNLSRASVKRVRDGYLIDLPTPIQI